MSHFYKKTFAYLLIFSLAIMPLASSALVEKLFYTTVHITHPLITKLIHTEAFQRLKDVHQYGIAPEVLPKRAHSKCYNRYNHSIGVWWLTQRYGAPLEEQAAALLHDTSHTAFSHVGDYIFQHKYGKNSYQDEHHLEFLKETDLPQALQVFNMTLQDIDHKNPRFTCLEQDLPDICADRLEYNLSAGILEELITPHEAMLILDHLEYKDSRWYFTDIYYAQKFAHISLWHTEHVWGSPIETYISEQLAQAIREALRLNIVTLEEIKHGTDVVLWQRLLTCNNSKINDHLQNILHAHEHEHEINKQPRNNKFRGINPWIKEGNEFKRLTVVDEKFKQEYERVRSKSYN